MKTIHEKSPCCRGEVWRFGRRRRQCAYCRHTWTVWQKKRGRKHRRESLAKLFVYLQTKQASKREPTPNQITPQAEAARMRILRDQFLAKTSWPELPKGELILLCDALIQSFNGKLWSLYIFVVRSIHDTQAVILPPLLRQGAEHSRGGWADAFATLPEDVKARVVALVSDGSPSAVAMAHRQGWVLQRCQFHLLSSLANYVRPGHLSRHRTLAQEIYPRVYTVLYEEDEAVVGNAIAELETMVLPMIRNERLMMIISGFTKHYQDYRAYLHYPQYMLPSTNNSLESLNSRIRELLFWAKGFRTPKSFSSWIEAFFKYQKTITCNGKHQQN